jgi:SpoIIAA-like
LPFLRGTTSLPPGATHGVSGKIVADGTFAAPQDCRLVMSVRFSIDPRASLIHTIGSGNVTLAEIDAHFSQLSQVWPARRKLDVLLDLSECTALPEIQQLRAVVSRIQMFGGRKRFGVCAIVARKKLLYGLMRVFELLANQRFVAVRVFRNQPSAMAWLRETSSAVKQKAS